MLVPITAPYRDADFRYPASASGPGRFTSGCAAEQVIRVTAIGDGWGVVTVAQGKLRPRLTPRA